MKKVCLIVLCFMMTACYPGSFGVYSSSTVHNTPRYDQTFRAPAVRYDRRRGVYVKQCYRYNDVLVNYKGRILCTDKRNARRLRRGDIYRRY